MLKSFIVVLLTITMISCSKSDSGSSNSNYYGNGSSSIRGVVTIMGECGTNSAVVQLSGGYGTSTFYSANVGNGSSFEFRVNPGTYTMRAYTNGGNTVCNSGVQGQIQVTYGYQSAYQVCLGQSCSGLGYSGTYMKLSATEKASGSFCALSTIGCNGAYFPGTGDVLLASSHIALTPKEDSVLTLDLKFSEGNNALVTIPSTDKSGWMISAKKDGTIEYAAEDLTGKKTDKIVGVSSLFYEAQIESKHLQSSDGFCDATDKVVARIAEYMRLAGYSEKAAAAFEAEFNGKMPQTTQTCVYPQSEKEIDQVVKYHGVSALKALRTWFIVVPQLDVATMKLRPVPEKLAHWVKAPKTDVLAALKKSGGSKRAVASEAAISAEEWGVGFLIER